MQVYYLFFFRFFRQISIWFLFLFFFQWGALHSQENVEARLDQLWALALKHNPSLAAQKYSSLSAEYRLKQENVFSSAPRLMGGLMNIPVKTWPSLNQDSMLTVGLRQSFWLPGMSRYRLRQKQAEFDSENARLQQIKNLLQLQLSLALERFFYLQEKDRILQESKSIFEKIFFLQQTQSQLGRSTGAQVIKMQAELLILDNRIFENNTEMADNQAEIDQLCGQPTRLSLPENFQWIHKSQEMAIPAAFDLEKHPAFQLQNTALAQAQARSGQAGQEIFSEVMVEANYAFRQPVAGSQAEDMLSLSVLLPLPVAYPWREKRALQAAQMQEHQIRENLRESALSLQQQWKAESARSAGYLKMLGNMQTSILPAYQNVYQSQLSYLASSAKPAPDKSPLSESLEAYRDLLAASLEEASIYFQLRQSLLKLAWLQNSLIVEDQAPGVKP